MCYLFFHLLLLSFHIFLSHFLFSSFPPTSLFKCLFFFFLSPCPYFIPSSPSLLSNSFSSVIGVQKNMFSASFETSFPNPYETSKKRGFSKSSVFSLEAATRAQLLRKSRKQLMASDTPMLHKSGCYFKKYNKSLPAAEIH